jgi:hypothetical protein
MDYMTAKETAIKWSISKRRVLVLCKEDRIKGIIRIANLWLIPNDSEKPTDLEKTRRNANP